MSMAEVVGPVTMLVVRKVCETGAKPCAAATKKAKRRRYRALFMVVVGGGV